MDTKTVAAQVLEQFESAFSEFLNPNTPQSQRNAIGMHGMKRSLFRSGICSIWKAEWFMEDLFGVDENDVIKENVFKIIETAQTFIWSSKIPLSSC